MITNHQQVYTIIHTSHDDTAAIHLSCLLLHLFSHLSPFTPWSKTTLSQSHMINLYLSVIYSNTAEGNLPALYRPPFQAPSIEKTSSCKHCTAGTPGRVLKTRWWELMCCVIKSVAGSFISGNWWFVCFSFPQFFHFCLSLNGKRSAHIAPLSVWYAYRAATSKCSSAQCQDWHGSLSVRVWITPSPIHSAALSKVILTQGCLDGLDEGKADLKYRF